MSNIPVPSDIRALAEGYCISTSVLSDTFIQSRITNTVIPLVENMTRMSFSGPQQITEYYSGNGQNTLTLRRRNITSLVKIEYVVAGDNFRVLDLTNVETIYKEGILKAKRNVIEAWLMPIFPKGDKNLKITYVYGFDSNSVPTDVFEAMTMLSLDVCLTFLEGRSGGGDVNVEGYSKGYGDRGKFTNIRRELCRLAYSLLYKYMTRI